MCVFYRICFKFFAHYSPYRSAAADARVDFKSQNIHQIAGHCANVADGNADQAIVDGTATHSATGQHLMCVRE